MADFFVIRTAAQKIEQLKCLQGKDKQYTRDILKDWLKDKLVSEAIFLASPSLHERLTYWYEKPDSKQGRKVEFALIKYFIRMTSRSTPFGLFAGIGLGGVSAESQLDFSIGESKKRVSRLDMGFIANLQSLISSTSACRNDLKVKCNPSLFLVGDDWRYIEEYTKKDNRYYRLSSAENDPFLKSVIEMSAVPVERDSLINSLCQLDMNITDEEANDYLTLLIEEKILIYQLDMPITGKRIDRAFESTLLSLPKLEQLPQYQQALQKVDALDSGFVNILQDYYELFEQLQKLVPDIKINNILQVDYFHSSKSLSLSKTFSQNLIYDLDKLNRLSTGNSNLDGFKQRFNQRYGQKAIPLNKLMDDEIGLGFSQNKGFESPLIGTVPFLKSGPEESKVSIKQLKLDQLLLDKLIKAKSSNAIEFEIKDDDLIEFGEPNLDRIPFSFSAMMSIYAENNGSLDKGNYRISLPSLSGPSAANLLGRFCHLDKKLETDVKALLRQEESSYPDAILAEIVHFPQGRIGNVIARPLLRDHEIPFMTDSSADKEFQIDIKDLWVFIEQNRMVLWSKSKNIEIIPRLSSAHNFANNSLGLYTFLCSLQHQNYSLPGFQWSNTFAKQQYLPRVVIGKIICSPQMWRIKSDEWLTLKGLKEVDFEEKVHKFKLKYSLPNWIRYSVGDNSLQIGLDNILLVDTFLNEIKKGQLVTVSEVLSETLPMAVKHGKDQIQHEIIVPLIKSGTFKSKLNAERHFLPKSVVKPEIIPGNEWLMLKIYTGNITAERILKEKLTPVINKFVKESAPKEVNWFYMRYGDPDWHIRLRIHSAYENLYLNIQSDLNKVLSPLYEQGLVNKIEQSTYQREIARYGGSKGILLSERLFQYDSECCLSLIRIIDEQPADIRWQTALIGCHKMLIDFGFDEKKRHKIIKQQREAFGAEFGDSGMLKKEIGIKYRVYQKELQLLMFSEQQTGVFQRINKVIDARSTKFNNDIKKLKKASDDNILSCSIEEIVKSYLHMFMNRIFISNARQQELLIYEFLDRLYKYSMHRSINV
ncbi:lantibiotic dehydratase [Flavobacterium sp. W21_SRS_FM6]|uniref:lantibiotic dehydratase n=1 Tax=Flavobacterium sp. W21_SRS_FM6 TaxID=3240268 RepID=UPI003F93B46A